jgi:hypothetical protein
MPQTDEKELKVSYIQGGEKFSVYTNRVALNLTIWDLRMQIMEIVGKDDDDSLLVKPHGTVTMSPLHGKALLRALESTIKQYEERFGEIDMSKLDQS